MYFYGHALVVSFLLLVSLMHIMPGKIITMLMFRTLTKRQWVKIELEICQSSRPFGRYQTHWPKILFSEKPFDECVSTNVLQLVHIGRNIFIEKKANPF